MKRNIGKICNYIFGLLSVIIVSYCIPSILILGTIKCPVALNNSLFFCDSYTSKQICEHSKELEHIEVPQGSKEIQWVDYKFQTNVSPFSKICLDYDQRGNNVGYIVLNIGMISEEGVDVRVCVFGADDNLKTVVQKVYEGINIFEIPLKDAKRIRVDFLTAMPTNLTIEQLKLSNQLVGVLPVSFFVCFFACFLVGIELLGICRKQNMKYQKVLYEYIVKGLQLLKEDITKIVHFVLRYKWTFTLCFIICVFAYAYNLMNFSLGVDEEREMVRSIGTLENVKELSLREGRLGLYLFKKLENVDGTFTAFVGEILAVIFIFLNIVVATKCFEVVSKKPIRKSAIVVFGGMLATLPFINAEIMSYSMMNAGVYFSSMLITTALLLVAVFYENKKKSRMWLALVLTVAALFFTEAHNVWFITGTVLINLIWVIANQNVKWVDWLKYVLHYVGLYISAFAIYMVVRSVIGENGYVGGYIQWQNGEFFEVLKGIIDWIVMVLTNKNLPGAIYLLVGIFIFIGFIGIYVSQQKLSRAWLILFLSLCLLFAPFLLCFVAGGKMPYRTMGSLMLLEAGMWFVVMNFIERKVIARYVLLVTAGVMIWKQSVWMNRIFYGADLCAELDMQMGYSIGEEIEKIAETKQIDKPVVFVGRVQHNSPNIYKIDAVGQSIFYREPSRYKVYLMRYLGFDFLQPTEKQVLEAKELAEDMNVWPLDGSVQEFDDVIVVRLIEMSKTH